MTNPSLKDQLRAIAPHLGEDEKESTPLTAVKQDNVSSQKNRDKKKQQGGGVAWLEYARYGVELLKAYFPQCFKESNEIKPLKIGIKQDLAKRLSTLDGIIIADKACMVSSLSYYVNSLNYHRRVVVHAERIDLDGNPAGIVTDTEAKYSVEYQHARNQKRKVIKKAAPRQEAVEVAK